MIYADNLSIPPLVSGGIMLTYRCTNACRHCLYRCGPKQPNEWMSVSKARDVFSALKKEKWLRALHLAGGEATIRFERLVDIIRLATDMQMPIEYLETNAFWCRERDETRERMKVLREAGLPGILVSASLFHNEFVPFSATRNAVDIGREVFGRENVFVYLPQMYNALAHMPGDGKHSLEEFCEWAGLDPGSSDIPTSYGVIPGGRATDALRSCYRPCPAANFATETCASELLSTSHFHIDHEGSLFTGLCAGIAAATIENLHERITPDTHPVFVRLCEEGPHGLMKWAEDEYDFKSAEETYVSKCDLCYRVRRYLHEQDNFPELRPHSFYATK